MTKAGAAVRTIVGGTLTGAGDCRGASVNFCKVDLKILDFGFDSFIATGMLSVEPVIALEDSIFVVFVVVVVKTPLGGSTESSTTGEDSEMKEVSPDNCISCDSIDRGVNVARTARRNEGVAFSVAVLSPNNSDCFFFTVDIFSSWLVRRPSGCRLEGCKASIIAYFRNQWVKTSRKMPYLL
jgi:hypothetical protein